MDKVVYQEAVRVGKERVGEFEEARQELMAADSSKPFSHSRYRNALLRLTGRRAELWGRIEWVKALLEAEGPRAATARVARFKRDIGIAG